MHRVCTCAWKLVFWVFVHVQSYLHVLMFLLLLFSVYFVWRKCGNVESASEYMILESSCSELLFKSYSVLKMSCSGMLKINISPHLPSISDVRYLFKTTLVHFLHFSRTHIFFFCISAKWLHFCFVYYCYKTWSMVQ